jgi:TDG/mug DNA glycosylase family protein
MLDEDGHVPHKFAELIWKRVECCSDHLLEGLRVNADHVPIVNMMPSLVDVRTVAGTRDRPTAAEMAAARNRTIPDVAGPGIQVLFAGINPSLYSAATGHHFARPGNRFWPALHLSGFTPRQFRPDEQQLLVGLGLGITNVVARATARADELDAAELRAGGHALTALAERLEARWLAVVGVTAYRVALGRRDAVIGPQAELLGGAKVWVLPNPSGLNASWPLPRLVQAFSELRAEVQLGCAGEPRS